MSPISKIAKCLFAITFISSGMTEFFQGFREIYPIWETLENRVDMLYICQSCNQPANHYLSEWQWNDSFIQCFSAGASFNHNFIFVTWN